LEDANYLVKQTQYMVEECHRQHQNLAYCHFQRFAIDYLLECGDLSQAVRACMPQVVTMWEASKSGDELYHTLEIWLSCERSTSRTAAQLYTHRNTVQYRLKKFQEICDFEDPRMRDYCSLSIMILNLYDRRQSTT
jgi:DNA-binding PucR family transcriptional regulator